MLLTNVLSRLLRGSVSLHRRHKTHRKPAHQVRSFLPRLEILEDRTVLSTLMVTSFADSGDGSLRAMIAAAQSGDQIVFDQSLQGQTITLTSGELALTKSLDIEGLGADQLAVSGNHASRVFNISGGVMVTIAGLTITDGLAVGSGLTGGGGGILNVGSTLTLTQDVLSNNEVHPESGGANGGASSNVTGARLTVADCTFIHNRSIGGSGAAGNGGGILNNSSLLTVSHTTFIGNQAIGGTGGGNAAGGAVLSNLNSTATITDSTFLNNESIGGDGGAGGFARGGGIYNNRATLRVMDSTFTGNQARGGNGGTGGGGASLVGVGDGGGIFSEGTLLLSGSTFTGNHAFGGSNGTGGTSGIGFVGFASSPLNKSHNSSSSSNFPSRNCSRA
jgi:hypothetical protein